LWWLRRLDRNPQEWRIRALGIHLWGSGWTLRTHRERFGLNHGLFPSGTLPCSPLRWKRSAPVAKRCLPRCRGLLQRRWNASRLLVRQACPSADQATCSSSHHTSHTWTNTRTYTEAHPPTHCSTHTLPYTRDAGTHAQTHARTHTHAWAN
jgi:hypothetical protein